MMYVLVFLFVLSVLIFFHELGHFVAAKACGIYVKQFSIGMPPRLFGVQIGETDYCISALPFGGYVMMAGQEDTPLSEEEREKEYGHVPSERWFNNRPIWQRMIVLVAGPSMNLVLALVLYGISVSFGADVSEAEISARIGLVEPGYPAATASLYAITEDVLPPVDAEAVEHGWKTGDVVVSINGRSMHNIYDVAIEAALSGEEEEHEIVLERVLADGTSVRFLSRLAPEKVGEDEHPRFGVAPFETALVGYVMPDMPAAAAGIQEGDEITRVNGALVDTKTMVDIITAAPEGEMLQLEILRADSDPVEIEIVPETIGRFTGFSYGALEAGTEEERKRSLPKIFGVSKECEASVGIRRKDIILSHNGEPATVEGLAELEREFPGEAVELRIRRPAVLYGLLEEEKELTLQVDIDSVRAVGIGFAPKVVHRDTPAARIIPEAARKSYRAVEQTFMVIWGLSTGKVSVNNIGGPIMIYSVTTKAAKLGLRWLLDITALISVNLFILNLLPLPVLDGGQMVVNFIEGLRGKPLSERFLVRYQQVGLFMIIGLMLYVSYNDVLRLIRESLP